MNMQQTVVIANAMPATKTATAIAETATADEAIAAASQP
jgi:hypothetical protein